MKKYLLAAALAGASSTSALAANITYDNYSFVGVSINITSPNDISGGAGPITLTEGGKTVVKDAWCMDVDNYLASSGTVGVLPFTLTNADSGLPGVPKTLTNTQLKVIGWLIDNGDKVDTNSTLGGAFQVAIWSEEYGSSFHYDAISGAFTTDVSNDLTLALSEAAGGAAPINIDFLVPGTGVDSQTLAFATGAPEPSTWAMGIIGFAVMGFMGWKRHAKMAIAQV
jgi:hypothetical protein